MNIVICDSIKNDLKQTKDFFQEFMSKYYKDENYCLQTFESSDDLIHNLDNISYDIAFLDIKIDHLSGIDVGKILKQDNPNCLVFFTAREYAYIFEVFEMRAFQFVIKPLDKDVFFNELHRLMKTYLCREFKFFFPTKEGKILLRTRHIQYVETYYNQLKIVMDDKVYWANIKQKETLYKVLSTLPFVQVHRSYLVNIENIIRLGSEEVYIKNGDSLPVSNRKRKDIVKKLGYFATHGYE